MTISTSYTAAFHDDHQDQLLSTSDPDHGTTTFPPGMAWMPLDGLAQQWATFAGTFLSYPAFTASSTVFSALALEAGALQQFDQACHSRFNGDDLSARAACEQTLHDLQDASSQWLCALYWLERLTNDKRHPLDTEDYAALRRFFLEATEQLQRVGMLTEQVQQACVLSYQQHGIMGHVEQKGR